MINVMVLGAEHSCTRIICGFLHRHPDAGKIAHVSMPSSKGSFGDLEEIWKKYSIEKVVLVTRDRSANGLSMMRFSSMKESKGKELAGKPAAAATDFAISKMKPFLDNHQKDVVVVNIESLFQHKKLVLRQTFSLLGLNPNVYPYDKEGKVTVGWFTVDLKVYDPNEKYFEGKKWPEAMG